MFEQLSLRFDHPCLLAQRLSNVVDTFRERYECLCEIRIGLLESSIRIVEHTTQRLRDLVNPVPVTLNRVGGGWGTKRLGPGI